MAHQTVLGLAALVVLAIYLYTWMSWQRFKKYKDIPGVESSLLFGHVPAMTRRIMAGSPISKDERRHGGRDSHDFISEPNLLTYRQTTSSKTCKTS